MCYWFLAGARLSCLLFINLFQYVAQAGSTTWAYGITGHSILFRLALMTLETWSSQPGCLAQRHCGRLWEPLSQYQNRRQTPKQQQKTNKQTRGIWSLVPQLTKEIWRESTRLGAADRITAWTTDWGRLKYKHSAGPAAACARASACAKGSVSLSFLSLFLCRREVWFYLSLPSFFPS